MTATSLPAAPPASNAGLFWHYVRPLWRQVAVTFLVLLLGILPAVSHALPRVPGPWSRPR